jgi:hypothetical protein
VRLVAHSLVLERAAGGVARLNGKLDAALSRGDLQQFNAEYKRRRLETRGRRFPSYNTALARLRGALAGNLAGSPVELIRGVFEDRA